MKIHWHSPLAGPNFFIVKRRPAALSEAGLLRHQEAAGQGAKEFKAGKAPGWPSAYGDGSQREPAKMRLKIQGSRGSR